DGLATGLNELTEEVISMDGLQAVLVDAACDSAGIIVACGAGTNDGTKVGKNGGGDAVARNNVDNHSVQAVGFLDATRIIVKGLCALDSGSSFGVGIGLDSRLSLGIVNGALDHPLQAVARIRALSARLDNQPPRIIGGLCLPVVNVLHLNRTA